jgi:hypothetical protein
MCVCVCVCVRDVCMQVFVRMHESERDKQKKSHRACLFKLCVCVYPCVASFSLSASVCVTDWVGGRTPACRATTLAPRGPSMWGPGWRSAPI